MSSESLVSASFPLRARRTAVYVSPGGRGLPLCSSPFAVIVSSIYAPRRVAAWDRGEWQWRGRAIAAESDGGRMAVAVK